MGDTKHWLYRLRLVDPSSLTVGFSESDMQTMDRHRSYIADLTAQGTCILAGRTDAGERTFGVMVFTAADENSARAIMQSDPAVAEGLMTAELYPFLLAFLARNHTAIL
jgi:uncharacterized protein YciI